MSDSTIIQLWKEKQIAYAVFTFNCGGDSMGDTSWEFFDKDGKLITVPSEIERKLDNEIYETVNFYVDSDGHYIGEAGNVHVTLEDDGEEVFTYSKSSQSEWSESEDSDMLFPLTDDEKAFIEAHVFNINGGSESSIDINFKHDFIMTDEEEDIVGELKMKIEDACQDYEPEDAEGELQDWYTYTTNAEEQEIEIRDNHLVIHMSNSCTIYKDE
jgi:hypothetical protein